MWNAARRPIRLHLDLREPWRLALCRSGQEQTHRCRLQKIRAYVGTQHASGRDVQSDGQDGRSPVCRTRSPEAHPLVWFTWTISRRYFAMSDPGGFRTSGSAARFTASDSRCLANRRPIVVRLGSCSPASTDLRRTPSTRSVAGWASCR